MTGSRGSGVLVLAAGLLAAVVLVPGPADAQGVPEVARPLLLAPPTRLEPPTPAAPPAARSAPVYEAPSGISVDALGVVAPGSVGTLTAESGGLGVAMWRDTPRELVDLLLPVMPVRAASTAMHDLGRRLLLSAAALPEGPSSVNLIAARAERLLEMGETDALFSLVDLAPPEARDGQLSRIEADAHFMSNDLLRACEIAGAQDDALSDSYWQQVYVFCRLLAGDKDSADLGISLLRETGRADAVFLRLAASLAGAGKATLDSMREPTPLLLAMARAAQASLPADVLGTDRPAALRTIAVSPNASFDIRLDAAERAEATGALATETLRDLYASATFSEEELANPLSRAEAESDPLSRALLYRTAVANTVPSARAEAVSHALQLAQRGGRYPSVARAFAPVIGELVPSGELAWFAPEAVRSLLAAGSPRLAEGWLSLLRSGALIEEERRARLAALLPLVNLAGSGESNAWAADNLRDWWQAEAGGPEARDRATLLYTSLEGLGETVPDELWLDLLGAAERAPAVMPSAALWYRLQQAARAGRVGETVLLSLLALGDGGPAQASPLVLRAVIDGLSGVGEAPAARALALEAALAAGL